MSNDKCFLVWSIKYNLNVLFLDHNKQISNLTKLILLAIFTIWKYESIEFYQIIEIFLKLLFEGKIMHNFKVNINYKEISLFSPNYQSCVQFASSKSEPNQTKIFL